MKLKLFITVAVTAAVFSCASKKEEVVIDESLLPAAGTAAAAQPVLQKDTALPGAINVQAGKTLLPEGVNPAASRTNPAPATGGVPPQAAAGTALNPPHGQPGHRCDINVGAPLNSKPVQAAAAPVVTNAPATATAQPAPQITQPGMNPAHGQPGHRCDIAVGAPLNSKPLPAVMPAPAAVQKDSTKG